MTSDAAPITAVMLTVQFAPLIVPLNPVQLGDLYAPFRLEFPVFEQTGRAGPMPLNSATMIDVFPTFSTLRNQFSTQDRRFNLLFQEDRLSFGWTRLSALDQPADYPGFASLSRQAETLWERLRILLFGGLISPYEPIVGEIAYTNQFDMQRMGRLSDVLTCVNPAFQANATALNLNWLEPGVATGMMQTHVIAPVQLAYGRNAVQIQVTSRFPIAGGWNGTGEMFSASHDTILESFKRLIAPAYRPI